MKYVISVVFVLTAGCTATPIRTCPSLGAYASVLEHTPTPLQEAPGPEDAEGRHRPCRPDAFVVDVPEEAGELLPGATDAVVIQLNQWLALGPVSDAWFNRRDCAFSSKTIGAPQHQLLTVGCGPDGNKSQGAILSDAQCGFLTALKGLYSARGLEANIARECDATGHYDERWDRTITRLPTSSSTAGAKVTIGVVDATVKTSGFDSGAVCAEANAEGSVVDDWSHGTAVTTLALDYAPGAQVYFFRGLKTEGGGPVSEVALALERLRKAVMTDSKLVVNLSIGWPREHAQPSKTPMKGKSGFIDNLDLASAPHGADPVVAAGVCTFQEGAVGRSVKTQLDLLANRPNTLIFAAAGNRRSEDSTDVFYPAAWTNSTIGVDWIEPLSLDPAAVSALPARDVVFAAPGAYIEAGALVGTSGTSLSTAIASGIAARMLETISGTRSALLAELAGSTTPWRGKSLLHVSPPSTAMPIPPQTSKTLSAGATYGTPTSQRTFNGTRPPPPKWPDRTAAGSVGPQPGNPCPTRDCYFKEIKPGSGEGTVVIADTKFLATVKELKILVQNGTKIDVLTLPVSTTSENYFNVSVTPYTSGKLSVSMDSVHSASGSYTTSATQPLPVYK